MEGKNFLCGKNTPPQLSRLVQDDFVFDLQRFEEDDTTGYSTAEGHKIQVGSGDSAKYFDDFKNALTYACTQTGAQTVTLLADAECSDLVKVNSSGLDKADSITVNLGGHTLTYTGMAAPSSGTRVKGLQVNSRNKTGEDSFFFTINGGDGTANSTAVGTIDASNQNNGKFQRFFTTYTDFTLNNVKVDATHLSAQIPGEDCAVICHAKGTLTLEGNTSIITKDSTNTEHYYAIGGRTVSEYNSGDFEIVINTTSDETIEYIGLYHGINRGGTDTTKSGATTWGTKVDFSKASVEIKQGNVGNVTYGENTVAKEGFTAEGASSSNLAWLPHVNSTNTDDTATIKQNIKISSGATFTSVPEYYSFDSEGDDKASYFAHANSKYYAADADGWYGATNNWNYVSETSADTTTKIAEPLASLTGDRNTLTLTNTSAIEGGIGFNANDTNTFGDVSKFTIFTAADVQSAVTVAGNANLTKITGGGLADSLTAGTSKVTLDGGAGGDILDGASKGDNVFVYNGGADHIKGRVDSDIVNLDGIDAVTDGSKVTAEGNGFKVEFSTNNVLTFEEGTAAKVRADNQVYTYSKDFIGLGKSITLASTATDYTLESNNDYNAVDAAAADAGSLVGNTFANTLKAGAKGNTLDGGLGNDNLYGGSGADTFVYGDKSGKDVIYNYGATDKLQVTATNIASGTTNSNGDLVFKINNSNSITFKAADDGTEVKNVILAGDSADSLTKDGVIAADGKILTVFSSQKGKVDISDSIYSGVAGINASKVTKNAITMAGGAAGGTFTFATNKKADVFEYGGGAVTLSSYETGTDKIDLGAASLQSFSVDSTGVSFTTDKGVISLGGAQGKEVLLHDVNGKNNSFSKMIFAENGVLYDKEKNPTAAILSTGAGVANNSIYTATNSIKKITVGEGVTAISVQAGSKNNTIIDATGAGDGVTLVSGDKNDKFTGRKEAADTFVYTAGKDVITNYESDDIITLGETYNLGAAKITQSRKSVTLKFSNKNSLNIKSDDAIGEININGTAYNFGKNAVISGNTASLTSNFSGTYKAGSGVTKIDGSAVADKNFTMQGTSTTETLTAGGVDSKNDKNRKVTFKGGGGDDSLVGGSGKDTFFYAKNDTGNSTVDYFSYANDNLKIKRTLTGISKASNGLEFAMGSGNSLTLKTDDKSNNIGSSNVLIKANNTLYWFEGNNLCTAKDSESRDQIKSVLRNKSNYAIVDLNYSTNLIKGGVAEETETVFTAAMASNYQIK